MFEIGEANPVDARRPAAVPPTPDEPRDVKQKARVVRQGPQLGDDGPRRRYRQDRRAEQSEETLEIGDGRIGDVKQISVPHLELLRGEISLGLLEIDPVDHRHALTRGCARVARNAGRLLPAEDEHAPRIRSVAPKSADSSERLRKRDSGSFEADLIV